MKNFRFLGASLMVLMLAIGFTACSGNEGARPSAEAEQEERAQPADQAAQPMEADEQSAGVQSPPPSVPAAEPSQEAAQAPETAMPAGEGETGNPEVAEIMGTVLDAGGEIMVFTDQGNYAVAGQDLSDMVGKTVRVLGSLQENGGRPTIKVISVYEIK
jgi:biotin carboxyl carrier protein